MRGDGIRNFPIKHEAPEVHPVPESKAVLTNRDMLREAAHDLESAAMTLRWLGRTELAQQIQALEIKVLRDALDVTEQIIDVR